MNDLSEKIRQGFYQPGQKLPTEPSLMAEQGVSRTVVREAISRLQAAGFVETRHGVGTFVLHLPAAETPVDFMTVVTIRDVLAMLELRISLETEAAGLAARRRTEEQLDSIRQACEAIDAGIHRGENAVDADFEFHLQIVLATGNKYFEDFYRHLGTTTIPRARVDTARLSPDSASKYLPQTNQEHRHILDAITRKDSESAKAGMRLHITNSHERLRHAIELAEQKMAAEPTLANGKPEESAHPA
jgi:GntR family transcriptional repressor for pyruvate dehydrogenase complex